MLALARDTVVSLVDGVMPMPLEVIQRRAKALAAQEFAQRPPTHARRSSCRWPGSHQSQLAHKTHIPNEADDQIEVDHRTSQLARPVTAVLLGSDWHPLSGFEDGEAVTGQSVECRSTAGHREQ